MKFSKLTQALLASVLAVCSAQSIAQSQGISKTEIIIGTILDQSGPLAGFGKQSRLGMQLRVDEVNEQGGIN